MKRKNRFSELLRPLGALALAGATLWTVSVTAGSATAADAWAALRQEVPLTLLRWQLGDPGLPDGLSPAAVLTLSQSPLLLSARRDIYELRRQSEETPEAEAPAPVTQPIEETPQTPEAETSAGTDNGVAAKTLIPTDPSGYTVFGRVYISNSTKYTLSSEELQKPFAAELTGEAPQVLILHTHGSEGYTPVPGTEVVWSGDCRTTDTRYNVVHMGDAIAEELGKAGISVLHDRTLYDAAGYNDAYDRAETSIQAYLEKYPSIHFVLDIHRDAIEDSDGNTYKVISDVNGKNAAQLSIVVGSDGSGLPHGHWQENLKLAVLLQQNLLEDYPTLMRPMYLRNSRYNEHATTGSLLVEVGAAGNSLDEALYAARLFAENMVEVLQTLR